MCPEQRSTTLADMGLQALVLTCVIEKAPEPVPVAELPVLLFEGRFSPQEEAATLAAASWLVEARLLVRDGDTLRPASPTGLARAD